MLAGARGGGRATYRVDALFYNAAHLIPGQLGQDRRRRGRRGRGRQADQGPPRARADEDRRALRAVPRRRQVPIRPQSLIGEKFVQCDAGHAEGAGAAGEGDEAPTVPVTRNEVPVDLDLVFASLRMPYRQRLVADRQRARHRAGRAAGGAERGDPPGQPGAGGDRRVLEIVDDDRAQLGRLIDASDEVIAELARQRGDVADVRRPRGRRGRRGRVASAATSTSRSTACRRCSSRARADGHVLATLSARGAADPGRPARGGAGRARAGRRPRPAERRRPARRSCAWPTCPRPGRSAVRAATPIADAAPARSPRRLPPVRHRTDARPARST